MKSFVKKCYFTFSSNVCCTHLCFLKILNCNYVAFMQNGELITDVETIRRHYMLERFKLDLISTIPFDLIAYLVLPKSVSWLVVIEEGPRILKLLRLSQHFGTLDKILTAFLDRDIPLAPFQLVQFFSGIVLIAHWAACGFFVVARWRNNHAECYRLARSNQMKNWATASAECLWEGTWIKRQIVNFKLPVDSGVTWQHYLRSFYWALPTLTLVVIGDVVSL